MTVKNEERAAFVYAWLDVRDRIDSGTDRLRDLRDQANGVNAERYADLYGKARGLYEAGTLWREVHATHPEDAAEAFRHFTASLVDAYRKSTGSEKFKQGLALALSYQRGYGPDIDAEPIFVLLPEAA